jgi:hypothetical protein
MFPNRRADRAVDISKSVGGEEATKDIIYSVADGLQVDPTDLKLPLFSPDDLLGLTFLKQTEDGQTIRAKVVRKIRDNDSENHQKIKFLVEVGDGLDEILAYNELSDLIEQQHEAEAKGETKIWSFKDIIGHQGPLKPSDKRYKGSTYNVLVQWEDGSETYEPLTLIIKDDPVTCARYALDQDLLEVPGWKQLKRIATREKLLKRMLKQSRLQSQRRSIRYKFGVQVPRTYKEALELDAKNGNTFWQEAVTREMDQIKEYQTFHDLGKNGKPLPGFQRITVHLVFDVKATLQRNTVGGL